MESETTLRDNLAAERTRLANERTFLAYIRTALALFAGGVALFQFFPSQLYWLGFAWFLLACGVITVSAGIYRFVRVKHSINTTRTAHR